MIGGICNNRRLVHTECYHPSQQSWLSLADISTPHASMHSYRQVTLTFNILFVNMLRFCFKPFCNLIQIILFISFYLAYSIYFILSSLFHLFPSVFLPSVCAYKNDVYITGGHSNSGCTVDTVSMYISKINQWNTLAPMQHPRERHGSAAADGDVYVAGEKKKMLIRLV